MDDIDGCNNRQKFTTTNKNEEIIHKTSIRRWLTVGRDGIDLLLYRRGSENRAGFISLQAKGHRSRVLRNVTFVEQWAMSPLWIRKVSHSVFLRQPFFFGFSLALSPGIVVPIQRLLLLLSSFLWRLASTINGYYGGMRVCRSPTKVGTNTKDDGRQWPEYEAHTCTRSQRLIRHIVLTQPNKRRWNKEFSLRFSLHLRWSSHSIWFVRIDIAIRDVVHTKWTNDMLRFVWIIRPNTPGMQDTSHPTETFIYFHSFDIVHCTYTLAQRQHV